MIEAMWNSLWAWIAIPGLIAVVLLVASWRFPEFRRILWAAAGLVAIAASLVAKGHRDRKRIEDEKREAAVKKVQEKYDEIERKPSGPSDVDKRLRDGTF